MLLPRITLALTIAVVSATVLLVSRAGSGRVFLMDLGRDVIDSDRARVLRVRIVTGLTCLAGVGITFTAEDAALLAFVATVLPLLPVLWMLVEVFGAVRSASPPSVPTRFRVPLGETPPLSSYVSTPLELAHVALVALSCAGFWLVRSQLPDRVPMHFDMQGNVNRWGSPDELWMMLGLMVFNLLLLWGISFGVARERWALPSTDADAYIAAQRRRRALIVRMVETLMLFVNGSLAATWLGIAVGSLPGRSGVVWVAVVASLVLTTVGIVGSLAGFIGPLLRAQAQIKKLGGSAVLGTHESGWRWGGIVYYAPADPALFVPKRFGIGQTLNFARPAAWILLAVVLMLPMGIAAAGLVLGGR